MGDIVMVLLVLAFFGVCVGYVSWCDRIIGPDPETRVPEAASTASRTSSNESDLALQA